MPPPPAGGALRPPPPSYQRNLGYVRRARIMAPDDAPPLAPHAFGTYISGASLHGASALPCALFAYAADPTPAPDLLAYYYLSPLPPSTAFVYGLPAAGVVAVTHGDHRVGVPPRVVTPAHYVGNSLYASLVRKVVGDAAPRCTATRAAAERRPYGAEVLVIDGRCMRPTGAVDGRDVLGAFRVRRDGGLGEFAENEGHQVLTRDGPCMLDQRMHAAVVEVLTAAAAVEAEREVSFVEEVGRPAAVRGERGSVGSSSRGSGAQDAWEKVGRSHTDVLGFFDDTPVWGGALDVQPFKEGHHRPAAVVRGAMERVRSGLRRGRETGVPPGKGKRGHVSALRCLW